MQSPSFDRQFAEAQRRHRQNDLIAALRIYDALLQRDPGLTPVKVYRALALVQLGRADEALAQAEDAVQALEARSGEPALYNTLAVVLRRLNRLDAAERMFRLALERDPANAAARNNLALVLLQRGKHREARPLFEHALGELTEDAAPALNLARIDLAEQDYDHAEAMLRLAKERQPGHADIPLLEALLAHAEADHPRAFAALMRTLRHQPAHAEAWSLLAVLDADAIDPEPAEQALAALVKARPTSAKLLATAVGFARKQLLWRSLPALEALLNAALEAGREALIDPQAMFLLLSANISQKAHRIAAHNGFEAFVARGRNDPRPAPRPRAGRTLRVAYLSSDLRTHPVGHLLIGVIEAHRRDGFEWIAYSTHPDDGSELRRRFRAAFTRFVNVVGLDDAALAARMREDGIDVLVDLNQMTAGHRLGVFCHGPAPVTVQWLGMPGTVGAGERIDYVLLDAWTGHPGNLDGFDEQPVLLAGSYQPQAPERPDLSLAKTRADWGLPDDVPVLCSFNQPQKLSPDTIALWAEILRRVPQAVLWIVAWQPALEERLVRIFTGAGIAPERIVFAQKAPPDVHRARLAHADLMLDNWPYNAHTTCSDALRAGVPVLTLPGATFASRVAAGVLEAAGLSEWIAASPEDYVAKAVAHCLSGRQRMDLVKHSVRDTYWASPLVDCAAFARRLEAFYEAAFARAERGEKPAPLWVEWNGAVHQGLPPAHAWRQTVLANRPDGRAVAEIGASIGAVASAPSASPAADWAIRKGSKEARLHNLGILAERILQLPAVPLCVDVGAKPEDPKRWDMLAQHGLVKVVGFDPQCDAVALDGKGNHTIVNCALGDGRTHTLHIAQADGMTSLLEPDLAWLSRFPKFADWGQVVRTLELPTRRADEVPEIATARFIKIDTQGSERLILEHAERLLDDSLVLMELELSPVPLYQGEPSFFAVGHWLEQRGWMLHHLPNLNRRMFKPLGQDSAPYAGLHHVFQVDAVFLPQVDRWPGFSAERLLALAFLAHALYGSFDVAALALEVHDAKPGVLPRLPAYRRYLEEAGLDA